MRDATLRQLQIFASVARHLSFSRASEELRLTQPAVSMQVKQLEAIVGLPLLERSGRRVRLTEAGQQVLQCSSRVSLSLRDAEEALAALRGLRGGRVGLAVVSTAKYFAPKLVALFSRAHPELEMKLAVHNRERVAELVAADEVDLALMGTAPPHLDALATPFARHPLVVIAQPDHPLAGSPRVPASALAREAFLVREPGSGTRAAMERYFEEHRVRPARTTEIGSNETIKQAVMAGMGLGFISQHAIGLELAGRHLVLLQLEGLPIVRNWNVVRRTDKRLSPAAQAFEEFVLNEGNAFLKEWPPGER